MFNFFKKKKIDPNNIDEKALESVKFIEEKEVSTGDSGKEQANQANSKSGAPSEDIEIIPQNKKEDIPEKAPLYAELPQDEKKLSLDDGVEMEFISKEEEEKKLTSLTPYEEKLQKEKEKKKEDDEFERVDFDQVLNEEKKDPSGEGFKEKEKGENKILSGDSQNKQQDFKDESKEAAKKPAVFTMADAIVKTKGENELLKWKKRLSKSKQKNSEQSPSLLTGEALDESIEEEFFSKRESRKPGIIRTYKADVQDIVKQNKLSITKIVALESDRRKFEARQRKRQDKMSTFNLALIIFVFSILFFAVSIFIAYVYYKNLTKPLKTEEASSTFSPEAQSLINKLLFIEDRVRIDITEKPRAYILNVLAAARDSSELSSVLGNVIELELVEKDIKTGVFKRKDVKDLVKMLYTGYPQSFIDSLQKDYMVGVRVTEKGRDPFLIFSTKSYHYAFAAMLNWESTMESDLGVFLIPGQSGKDILPVAQINEQFKDMVFKNYDLRILEDENGKVKIVYGFVNDDVIVITHSIDTFVELAKRIRITRGK